jgi:hypothetical protein
VPFTVAVIVLSAKRAKADGSVAADEVKALNRQYGNVCRQGRASCFASALPPISDVDLFRNSQGVVYCDAEIPDGASILVRSSRS